MGEAKIIGEDFDNFKVTPVRNHVRVKEEGLNMSIGEEQVECPLCMEPLEMDDINFYPCTCGYQICRFCWNRIRTDENGLCPACRKSYPEDPAAFKPLTEDELQRIKRERKMKDLQRKQKAAENRKHLANVRVVQKNLVFAVGLSQRLADTEVLKKHDYFGKFGKIVKVVINQSTSYAGSQCSQGPSASAYITYHKAEDALRAIQAVNNIHVDGRTIKASLGTTKYCSHFLRGTQCPKPDCMYLHELGDEAASFTKEEMQQGKHQEYEQKLYEQYMNHLNTINATSNHTSAASTHPSQSNPVKSNQTRKKTHSPATTQRQTPPQSASQNHTQNTEVWPSLHTGGQIQSKPSTTDSRTTNSSKGPPTTHSNHLSNSLGSLTTNTSSNGSCAGTTHKRNLSSDLQHSGGSSGSRGSQRQSRTPDPHTASRAQHSVTEGNCSQSQQLPLQPQHNPTVPPPPHQSNNSNHPSNNLPTQIAMVNNCTPPSQLSPPQIQTPPSSQLNRHTPNLGSPTSPHTQQTIAPQRKPLYGNSNTESLSLFSNSGFPVTRHPVGTGGVAALKQHHPAAFSNSTATSGGEEHTKLPTNGPEIIPDTISVSSSTDWQAAFGFQPSMLSSQVRGNGMIDSSMSHSSSSSHHGVTMTEQQQQGHSVQDTSADDDLGFDPWNESTKALQDLIEKEAVTSGPNHLHHQQQQQLRQSVHHRYHNNATQQHNQQMLEQPTSKPIPPGFTPSQLSAFYQNPLLGGSRVLGKLPQSSYPQNGVGMDSLADLALCGAGGPGSLGPAHSQSMPPADSFNMKSWQEGLRALLPNINIHFGNPQAVGEQMHMMNNPPAAGASGLPQQHHAIQTATAHQKTVQQQKSPKNSWDLTCDPAVVTSGNIADGPEEPHWMASLHHLTEDTGPSLQPINPGPQQHNNPYSSRFLPFRQQHSNPQQNSTNTAGGPSFPPTAPPPGFQNSIRPPPHLAAPGMLESRKQLMDAFQ